MKTSQFLDSGPVDYNASRQMEPVATEPTAAPVLRAFGQEMLVLLSDEQTGGRCTVLLDSVPPGLGTPLHYHEREDEVFHVLEGRAAFWLGSTWREVPVGNTVFAPRKVYHGFKNVGDSPLRVLITLTPSGFEKWFARCAREFAGTDDPNLERLTSLAAEHGMHFPDPADTGRPQRQTP